MARKNPHAAALGKKGGKARWEGLSPEQRSEIARKAIQARWAKAKRARAATTPSVADGRRGPTKSRKKKAEG